MNLYLRKVVHPQAHENYRVVLKLDGNEFEIGSIGIQHGAAWRWGIDTVIPMRAHGRKGKARTAGTACGNSKPPGSGLPVTRPTWSSS